MNTRERMLAVGVLIALVIGGAGVLFKVLYLDPLTEHNEDIANLQKDVYQKQERLKQIEGDLPRLARWQRISLPADKQLSKREYANYLSDLMRESGFAPGSFTIASPHQVDSKTAPSIGKTPIYDKLDYAVHVYTGLDSLVKFLEHFYRSSLLQQVKKLTVQRQLTVGPTQKATDLDINFTVEALIINGAENRQQILPGVSPRRVAQLVVLNVPMVLGSGPTSVALMPEVYGSTGVDTLARSTEQYAALAGKNIFLGEAPPAPPGPAEVAVARFVFLNHIRGNGRRTDAFLYNRYTNQWTRIRAESGFDYFRILDEKGDSVVKGRVIRVDNREVIFRVDDKYYSVHVGQTLEDALKKALTAEQRKGLGLVSTTDKTVTSKQ